MKIEVVKFVYANRNRMSKSMCKYENNFVGSWKSTRSRMWIVNVFTYCVRFAGASARASDRWRQSCSDRKKKD